MNNPDKTYSLFTDYLNMGCNITNLTNASNNLDDIIDDSRKFLTQLRTMYSAVGNNTEKNSSFNDITRHDEISKFLESGPPNLLLSGMKQSNENTILDVDKTLDKLKLMLKQSNEDIKKKSFDIENIVCESKYIQLDLLGLKNSIDQLSERMTRCQSFPNKNSERNVACEDILQKLCQSIELFSQMVESKTILSETSRNMTIELPNTQMQFLDTLKNIVGAMNEITFLLMNKSDGM